MIRYVFGDGPVIIKGAKNADPQAIGEALATVAAGRDGQLLPTEVVDAARDNSNPLHQHFEWDDGIAAEKFRLEQARDIIRCIRVEKIGDNTEPSRAFLSINDGGTSYRSVQEVRESPDLQAKLLAAAERDLEAFTTRYRSLKDICDIIETAKKAIKSKRKKDETRKAA